MADKKKEPVCVVDAATKTAAIYGDPSGNGYERTEYASGVRPVAGNKAPFSVGSVGDYQAALRYVQEGRVTGPSQAQINLSIEGWKGQQAVGSCTVTENDGATSKFPIAEKQTLQMAPVLKP